METRLCESERRFMELVWQNEPLGSKKLSELSLAELGWKKSTAFTMLRRLIDKGFLKNENSTVSSLVGRDEVRRCESAHVVDSGFGGSLPAFVAAFTSSRPLSEAEAEELRRLIDESRRRSDG